MSKTIRKRPYKYRNWRAVDARSRTTAGPMGDDRKEESRKGCRQWKQKHFKEDVE